MNNIKRIVFAACLILVAVPAYGQVVPKHIDRQKYEALTSRDQTRSGEVLRSLKRERQLAKHVLLAAAVSARTDVQTKARIFELLGQYRCEDGFSVLFGHLDFAPPHRVAGEDQPLLPFPAAEALAEIGSPAARKMVEHLQNSSSPVALDQLKIMAFVLYQVDGQRLAVERLRIAMEEARGQSARKNLSQLMELFKSIDFTDSRQWPRPRVILKEEAVLEAQPLP